MLLSVKDRLQLLQLAEKAQGNLTTLRLVREFQRDLGFSEEELTALAFEQEGGQIKWRQAVEPKDITVGPSLRKAVAKWFDPEKLTLETMALYERFAPEEE